MGMYIDDNRVCSICGAYENTGGYCSNGHLFENPITKEEFDKKVKGKENGMDKSDKMLDNVIVNQSNMIKSWLEDGEMMGKIVSKLSVDELKHLEFQAGTELQARQTDE